MHKAKLLGFSLALLSLLPFHVSAANKCTAQDDVAKMSCKVVNFKGLPVDLKQFMKKAKCGNKSGSNYDSGYAVDLNADGNPEYAFCCNEAKHGPCGIVVYGKMTGKWSALSDELYFPSDDSTPCNGFVPLETKSSTYNDLCIDEGSTLLKFKNEKYQEVQ